MTLFQPLLIATRNRHKTDEIRVMLGIDSAVEDLNGKDFPLVEETGTTFLANATLKAVAISKRSSGLILSDDSGIEVDALGGAPGVYSSSYGGEEGNHAKNNLRLLAELAKLPEDSAKSARFRCVMVLAKAGEVIAHFEGTVEGSVSAELRGEGGFGYDPMFTPKGFDQTFAELGSAVKNDFSHRGRALAKVVAYLKSLN